MTRSRSPQSTAVHTQKRSSALPITDTEPLRNIAATFAQSVAKHEIPRLAYKVAQAAMALGIDRGAVYDLIKVGRLRYQRLAGGTIIIPKSALDEFLNDAA